MPRIVDESKMQRIKDAAIQLVVEKSYGGASISAIAKNAGVAEGYLYRYYNGKQDLILDLLHFRINVLVEMLEDFINTCTDVKEIIKRLYQKIFDIAKEHPDQLKFIHVLMHDYNFQVADEQREKMKSLSSKVIQMGIKKKDINPNVTEEEIFLMTIVYPIEFINMKLKNFFGNKTWNEPDIKRLTNFCINALKY
ncbi:MAG: TetR/AcrR family transcriptional regulator [Bacteroidales bacterium]|jgi:AcrR family transcriptional regulator|nr:TetR/AcrR family transcriptional regulator [Bacteroidales bacterium]